MEVDESVVVYEYMISNGKFVKYIHEAKRNCGAFEFKKNNNRRTVYKYEFDTVKNSRALLFEDDEEKARKMLVEYYKNQIEKLKKNLEIAEKNLSTLGE